MELLGRQRHARQRGLLVTAGGAAGFLIGLLVEYELAGLVILAAIAGGAAFKMTR